MTDTTPADQLFRDARIAHWNAMARESDKHPAFRRAYRRLLTRIYRFLIPEGSSVLELGCGQGELLAALKPGRGVGVDFAPDMLTRAREHHPELTFVEADVHDLKLNGTFDYIILSDLVNDVWDVQRVFEQLRPRCTPRTRIILNAYSRLWQLPLNAARRIGVANRNLLQNWLTVDDISGLLHLAGFETVRAWPEILFPASVPLLTPLMNRWLAKLWPCRYGCLTNFVLARPAPQAPAKPPTVTVVVPARNEAGNIEGIMQRTPELGGGTELIFVEGNSTDDTGAAIEAAIKAHPERNCKLFRQTGKGKGDAVRLGYAHATGDILMILDADMTVPPEDLPRFYEAIASGKGEFINGVRLVYPMEDKAMRFCNLVANKFFSLAFSWLLQQPIKDTLCGTKVMWRTDYNRVAANRAYFGDFDPFGDFDLLFGAAKLNLKLLDLPIRYRERTYGTTNIQRWRHGVLLLRMVLFAARRVKFV